MRAFVIFTLFFCMTLSAAETIDMFKLSYENKHQALFFKSTTDPEIVKSGDNLTVLFSGKDFVKERKYEEDSIGDKALKRVWIKNYPNKGGAVNVAGNAPLSAKIMRISPDVVKVEIAKAGAATALVVQELPPVVPEEKAAKINLTPKEAVAKKEIADTKKEIAAPAEKPLLKESDAPKKEIAEKAQQPENKEEKEAVAALAKPAAEKPVEKTEKSDFLASLDTKEEKSGTPTSDKLMLIMAIFVVSAAGFLFFKKRGKNGGLAESSLLSIVETLSLGLKEKLMLVNVAGTYVLLFMRDKDVRELAVFKGDDAEDIKRELGKADLSDVLGKDIAKHNSKQTKTENVISSRIKPFRNKLEQLIENETMKRNDMSIEDEVFSTISKLKGIKAR